MGSLALASVTGAQNPCDVFKTMSCPISEVDILGEHTTADTAECQTWCTQTEDCTFFTHYIDIESCYILAKCDEFLACENCISGPATPSFESCQSTTQAFTTSTSTAATTTDAVTPSTTTQSTTITTSTEAQFINCDYADDCDERLG